MDHWEELFKIARADHALQRPTTTPRRDDDDSSFENVMEAAETGFPHQGIRPRVHSSDSISEFQGKPEHAYETSQADAIFSFKACFTTLSNAYVSQQLFTSSIKKAFPLFSTMPQL